MESKRIRSKIVMLPTKDKNALIVVHQGNKMLGMNTNSVGYTKQYLYFTTDEKIEEGDWVLDMYNQKWKLLDKKLVGFNKAGIRSFSTDNIIGHLCKKIVATTDTSLGLPQPTTAFIKKYVELGGIDEVDLEYEGIEWLDRPLEYFIKVDSHNTITIHAIKNSWNREELDFILDEVMNLGMVLRQHQLNGQSQESGNDILENWKNENL